jgi:hypothetical protein
MAETAAGAPWSRHSTRAKLGEPRNFVPLPARTRTGEGEFEHLSLGGNALLSTSPRSRIRAPPARCRKLFGALIPVGADSLRAPGMPGNSPGPALIIESRQETLGEENGEEIMTKVMRAAFAGVVVAGIAFKLTAASTKCAILCTKSPPAY